MYFTSHPESSSNEYCLYIFLFKFPYLESNNFRVPFWYLSHVITLRQFDSRQPSHSQYNIYEVPGNRYKSSLSEILFYYFILLKEIFSVILANLWICAHTKLWKYSACHLGLASESFPGLGIAWLRSYSKNRNAAFPQTYIENAELEI